MSSSQHEFVSSAEAAYIAGVSDREINRAIDEHILPANMVQKGGARRVARLAAPFVSFYFFTELQLTAQLRKDVLATIAQRLDDELGKNVHSFWSLRFSPHEPHTKKLFHFCRPEPVNLSVDMWKFVLQSLERTDFVERALEQVTVDAEILAGTPVFKGTRVPVENVLASLDAGVSFAKLRQSYEFLTEELVEAARIYVKIRPRRGRPSRFDNRKAKLELESSEIVRAASPRS